MTVNQLVMDSAPGSGGYDNLLNEPPRHDQDGPKRRLTTARRSRAWARRVVNWVTSTDHKAIGYMYI